MCGLNGIYAYGRAAHLPDRAELIASRDHMFSRGPDGEGEWWSADRRLALGHRRLSIIDLSDRASQPMESACGRYTIVFNGEIYNFPELRRDLEKLGRIFRTSADTEVLLHLYALKGASMVQDLRGMFAFAIWDAQNRSIILARDHLGIKPLYYANDGQTFRFASQVKALLKGGAISNDPNPAGLVGFYLWGSVPDPHTLYRDIKAVPAGHYMLVDAAGSSELVRHFCLAEELADGDSRPCSLDDIKSSVRHAAKETVGAHLLADVEVGLFLSGGVDSGALLGLMRDAGAEKIRAITLAFKEYSGSQKDEAHLASLVAGHYGAEHHVRFVDKHEFLTDLPQILNNMDQPSIDGINTYFVSKAAKEAGLKVAISGVGADELLAGYPSFNDIPRWVRRMRPMTLIPGLGKALRRLICASGLTDAYPKLAGLPEYGGGYPGAYLLRRGLFMPWELSEVLNDPSVAEEGFRKLAPMETLSSSLRPGLNSPTSRVAALEGSNYMRNQLLRDADWAGMAHSLEIRVPLVDKTFLKNIKMVTPQLSGRVGKEALAAAPSRPVPSFVSDRAKVGFYVPVSDWISEVVGVDFSEQNEGKVSRGWAKYVADASHATSEAFPLARTSEAPLLNGA
jgi:asparagine synthase (glutamine-hydrolysing)